MGRDHHHRRGGGGRNRGGGGGGGKRDRPHQQVVDSSDPVQIMFGEISSYLDTRHDRRERIVKLSRDICIESKRIIFCLHRIRGEEDAAREDILQEADRRLAELRRTMWLQVARELRAEDHYQYLRAYSAGLQEWVEALSFYDFLRNNNISSFAFVSGQLVFGAAELEAEEGEQLSVTVPQSEYILGLADLTGELMRNAINALGAGNLDACFALLGILQSMAEGFGQLPKQETPREFGQKLWTLKQSCRKVEAACYEISVRGSEIPKNHWADVFAKREEDKREESFGASVDDFYCD